MRRSLVPYLSRLGTLFRRWKSWPSRGSRVRSRRQTRLHHGPARRLPAVGRGVEQLEHKLAFSASPADPTLIADINALPAGLAVLNPANFVAVGSTVFFTAGDPQGASGIELWKTDGTLTGTKMVADINPGGQNSEPTALVSFKNALFFTADDGVNGRELWKSDGSEAGTVMVTDLSQDLGGGLQYYAPNPHSQPQMVVANNMLFFSGFTETAGFEPWKSDGTDAGTTLIRDVNAVENTEAGSTSSSLPGDFVAVGNVVFFSADDGEHGRELWKSDGTLAGTVLVSDINPYVDESDPANPIPYGSDPYFLTNVGGTLYFAAFDDEHGAELWKSNGTAAGTVLVRDINTQVDENLLPMHSYPGDLTAVGSTLYFTADDGVNGRELWKSTGTAAGTVLVRDINKPADPAFDINIGSDPGWLTAVGSTLYFSADDGKNGRELWKSNGTVAGTVLVTDINGNIDESGDPAAPPLTLGSNPEWLTNVGGKLYFTANDGYGYSSRLWRTDGTAAGTVQVPGPNGSEYVDGYFFGQQPTELKAVGTTLYFAGTSYTFDPDTQSGQEIFFLQSVNASIGSIAAVLAADPSGKTADGTEEMYPGSEIGSTFAILNGVAYFAASNGTTGYELWKSDGSAAGTVLVKDIRPGKEGSEPGDFKVIGNTLFFSAEGPGGVELWKTDGTATGTVQVKEIAPGAKSSNPRQLTVVNGKLFFTADNGVNGRELWKSDGTAAGTVMVKNIRADVPNSSSDSSGSGSYLSSSAPEGLVVLGSTLFFSADDGIHGRELWKSDGTAAGTSLVADIDESTEFYGSASYAASGLDYGNMVVAGNKLFFAGKDADHGLELWQSDGTTAGTSIVIDLAIGIDDGVYPYVLNGATSFGNRLFFSPDQVGLWVSDGTEAGTVQLANQIGSVNEIVTVGSTAYFTAADYGDGSLNLWTSDGTPEGTTMLSIVDGDSQIPLEGFSDLQSLYGSLSFMARQSGAEKSSFWHLDDPQDTGSLIIDGANFQRLAPIGGALGFVVFAGDDGQTGLELWKADAIGEKPTVTIDIDRTQFKKGDTAKVSFTLSEASTSFAAGDVTVTGGSISAFAGSGTKYTATFTPSNDFVGEGAISVSSGGFIGELGLANTAASLADPLAIDTAVPTVKITSSAATLKAGETATITFALSEDSADFTLADVAATGGTLADFSGSGSTYSATFTPTASSTAGGGITVAASMFTDAAGNPNAAGSLPVAIKIDTVIPTATIASSKAALKIGETAVITFTLSKPLTGFSLASTAATGGVLSKLAGSGTKYTATFTPAVDFAGDGTVAITANTATDAAGNGVAAASLSPAIKVATIAPTISIASDKSQLKAGETAVITFSLSAASSDFALADVTATGGSLAGFTGSGATYSAIFTPTAGSTAAGAISVTAGKFKDVVGNTNAAGILSPSIKIDTVAPSLKISSDKASLKIGESAKVTFTTSEATSDFSLEDVSSSGGVLSDFTGSGTTYTATFTPTAASTAAGALSVAAAKFTDAAGNPNVAGSLPAAIKIDTVAPSLSITTSAAALAKSKTAKITFTLSEPSTTFALSDVLATGGTLSAFTGKGASYSAIFTPTPNVASGNGTVSVAAGTFSDLAGNPSESEASLASAIKIDGVAPAITITSDKAALKAGETAIITFSLSEDSADFTLADAVATGGTLSSFAGSGSSYSATFTPKAGSTVAGAVTVAAAKFLDAAGNPNTAGSLATAIKINTVQPLLKIISDKTALKAGESAKITFAVSESVTDFTLDDIAATGGSLSSFTGSGKSYSAVFTPSVLSVVDGAVTVAAGKLTNAAGNGNPAAALAAAIKIDTVLPTITITSDLSNLTVGTKAKITFTLSEASTTFALADVVATNGTLSAFSGSGTSYTATFTPKAGFKGTGTISVAAGKFTDKIGNNNESGELVSGLTIDT